MRRQGRRIVPARCRRAALVGRPFRLLAAVLAVAVAPLVGAGPAAAANREPFASAQWGLRQVGADVAWDVTRGAGARVGIVDTGIDLGHVELAGKVIGSTRCLGTAGQVARCGGSAMDDSGHGTHVAGVVAAPLDGVGVAGVAPDAGLLVVKALRADGSGEAYDVAAGIDWLVGQHADVVNLSLAETLSTSRVPGSPLEAAIRRAAAAGVVVVLAAGNHGGTADSATALDLPAVVVGATDRNGHLARYSLPLPSLVRWGLVAPGGDGSSGTDGEIVSTYWFAGRRNAYAWSEGTSMSAPHVAGVAALLAAQGIRGQAAVDRLLATASAASCGPGCRGLVSARGAVGVPPPAGAQAVSSASGGATPASPPPGPIVPPAPPVSAVAPASTPATARSGGTDAGPDPGPVPVAVGPTERPVRLEAPAGPRRSWLASEEGSLAVVAGLALLAVSGAIAACSWRRLRADAGW